MNRSLRWYDYLTVNVYFLGLTFLSQSLGLIYPLLVVLFVGEENKGTYFGYLRLGTLMIALLMQSFWGLVSDHSRMAWGRRRPFIFVGTLFVSVFMVLVGFLFSAQGQTGYWLLYGVAVVLIAASNMPHAAAQGLIPDLVPEEKRGAFSGVKAVLEIPLPVILVGFTVGTFLKNENYWAAIIASIVVLLLVMVVTLLVPEKKNDIQLEPLNWKPFLNLIYMTIVYSLIILGLGLLVILVSGTMSAATPVNQLLLTMGLAGLLAMLISVVAGVWIGVRIGLGAEAAHNSAFTWWVVNRLAFLVAMINLSTFALFYYQSRLGYSASEAAGPASQLTIVVGVMIFLSALAGGWLVDRLGHKPMLLVAAILGSVGSVIVLTTRDEMIIFLGGALIGLGAGLFYAANWALGTLLAPRAEAARYLGISNLAGAGAGAIGASIGGPIADFFTRTVPNDPGLGYSLIFAIYAALFLVSALALLRIPMPKQTT
jgi:MFS family permease